MEPTIKIEYTEPPELQELLDKFKRDLGEAAAEAAARLAKLYPAFSIPHARMSRLTQANMRARQDPKVLQFQNEAGLLPPMSMSEIKELGVKLSEAINEEAGIE